MYRKTTIFIVLAIMLSTGGCEKPATETLPLPLNDALDLNVLLVTLDTTRADRLGCYGHAAARTPALDGLAASGVRFERAYCQVPLTLPSHTCLLTGTYPPTNGIHVNGAAIVGKDIPTLAEAFQKRGYRTGAFLSAWVLNAAFGLDRGFDRYDDRVGGDADDSGVVHQERSAKRTAEAALAWLGEKPAGRFFAWVHFFDPHHPYTPPSPFDRDLEDPYDGEIAFMDSQFARLLEWLDQSGLRERTLIVVVGDHGEAFGEHGETEHGLFLYNSTTRVPLIFSLPTRVARTRALDVDAQLADVAPTILDLLDMQPLAGAQGRSLRPALETGTMPFEPIYAESDYARVGFGWASLRSFTTQAWKYIDAPRPELYDRAADPDELANVLEAHADIAERMRRELDAFVGKLAKCTAENASLDDADLRALEGLGYVGGSLAEDDTDANIVRRDPKDMVDVYHGLLEAQRLSRLQRFEEVVPLLEPLALQSPESDELRATLGEAYLKLNRLPEAEREYRAALRTVPNNPRKLCRLGDAIMRQGRIDEALEQYQQALAVSEDYEPAHNKLGVAYLRKQQIPQAVEHFRRCVELAPHSANALTNLANLLTQMGRLDEALKLLRAALQNDSNFAPAHRNLWQVLAKMNRGKDAIKALRNACRVLPDDISLKRTLAGFLIQAGDNTPGAAQEALELALLCCEQEPGNPQNHDALGIAHAAMGDFVQATNAARRALELANQQGRTELAGRIAQRLEAYQAGQQP